MRRPLEGFFEREFLGEKLIVEMLLQNDGHNELL